MNTAVAFDCDEGIVFFVIEEDVANLDGVYLNDEDVTEEDEELFLKTFYPNGETRRPHLHRSEFVKAIEDGARLIVCGELA